MPQCGLRELNRWCIFNRRIVTQSVFWGGAIAAVAVGCHHLPNFDHEIPGFWGQFPLNLWFEADLVCAEL